MPVMFDGRARTRTEAMRRGEKLFEFYDSCGRAGYDEFRSIVNKWLLALPPSDQEELVARMQKGGNRDFLAGSCELTTHAFLRGLGLKVVVHPALENSTKHPDFAATDDKGKVLAYVEATTINPPSKQEGATNRENLIYNAIDGAHLPPGCFLSYDVVRAGSVSPSLKTLVADVEKWASANVEAARNKSVVKNFTAGDWEIELKLFIGSSSEPPKRAIGIAFGGAALISPHDDLKSALSAKSDKYGSLKAPYLIVTADAKEQMLGADDIREAVVEALLGSEIVQVTQGGDVAGVRRAKNGFWTRGEVGTNQNVSGVILLPDTGLWTLRSEHHQPILAVNPWAEYPLPEVLTCLPRMVADGDRWIFRDGKNLADILGLPDPWPPAETK